MLFIHFFKHFSSLMKYFFYYFKVVFATHPDDITVFFCFFVSLLGSVEEIKRQNNLIKNFISIPKGNHQCFIFLFLCICVNCHVAHILWFIFRTSPPYALGFQLFLLF